MSWIQSSYSKILDHNKALKVAVPADVTLDCLTMKFKFKKGFVLNYLPVNVFSANNMEGAKKYAVYILVLTYSIVLAQVTIVLI
jgi:hypothetical protein